MAERPAPLSPATLRLVGHIGQTALDRIAAGGVAIVAELDQHVAHVRAELAAACQERPVVSAEPAAEPARATCPDVPFATTALHAEATVPVELLLHYASGFVQAALGDGWVPAASAGADDWVSLRLAAICQLIRQAEAAATAHPDLRTMGTAGTDQRSR
jgi:Family of unknown function (DUF6401)